MITAEFLITALIVVLVPGTGVIFTVSTGITQGRAASIWAALGCTAGIVPHLSATILGLAAVMHTSALAFQTLKYAGVIYLLYIACSTWQDRSSFQVDISAPRTKAVRLVIRAMLLNVLNPKLTIFFLAFLPQFIHPDSSSPLTQLLLLSSVFMVMTFAVFIVYGLLAHSFKNAVIESQKVQNWLRRGFAATFAALGLNLAFSEK